MSNINQIKSYTSNSIKKEITNFFVFLGGVSGGSETVADETDISVLSRITKNDVSLVTNRVNWARGAEYTPFYIGSSGDNTYVYNKTTDMVYLCVGKNQPIGLIGETTILSTNEPNHYVGVKTYSDGYSWMSLYRLDFFLSKFLTLTELPINSLYDFSSEPTSISYTTKYDSICAGGDAGATGDCYFYYNEDSKDPITSQIYKKGDRVSGIGEENWICATCHSVGSLLNYKSVHIVGSLQSEIKRNSLDQLELKINENQLDVNDKFYIQYLNYDYYRQTNKGLISLQLDVSSLSIEDRIVKEEKPEITILDPIGFEASANIETYYDIRRNAFIANGITLRSSGRDFINPSFVIPNAISSKLQNSIKAVILPDISDPSVFLPNVKISVIKQLTSVDLQEIGSNQEVFTKTGIVSNVRGLDDSNPVFDLDQNEPLRGRTTSKIKLEPTSSELPTLVEGEVFIESIGASETITIKNQKSKANSLDYTSKLVSKLDEFVESTPVSSTLEISGVDELLLGFNGKLRVNIDNTEYVITEVSLPEYKIDNIEYVATRNLDKNIILEQTGSQSSIKLSFIF
jgi:hypothetical protein